MAASIDAACGWSPAVYTFTQQLGVVTSFLSTLLSSVFMIISWLRRRLRTDSSLLSLTAILGDYSDSSDDENYGDTNHGSLHVEDDEDEILTCSPSQCLFCQSFFNTGDLVLNHVEKDHQVPLSSLFTDRSFDFYNYVKLVNYIRKHRLVESDLQSKQSLSSLLTTIDDSYMIPTVEDDGLLQFDFDTYQENLHRLSPKNGSAGKTVTLSAQEHKALLAQTVQFSLLKDELQQLKGSYSDVVAGLRSSAQRFIASEPTQQEQTSHAKGDHSDESQVHKLTDAEDDGYISSYSHYSIHLEMLQDVVRTASYKEAICSNMSLFKDKVVLDVGCGTGILSMFAAKAGAAKVIAVDMSDIVYQAIDIVRENGLEEKVTVIKGRAEEICLPIDKVDIIISEWMGYFLLFESMLDSVLFARDKWLRLSGTVWPNSCTMHLTASCDPALFTKNIAFWDDVYGCQMSCMKREVCRDALVQTANMEHIACAPALIKTVDCCSCVVSDLDFSSDFSLCLERDCTVYALIGYFDTLFHCPAATTKVSFSTGPLSKSTHWKQTVFLLPQPLSRVKGQSIAGSIDVRKLPKDPRSLQVEITIDGKKQKYIIS